MEMLKELLALQFFTTTVSGKGCFFTDIFLKLIFLTSTAVNIIWYKGNYPPFRSWDLLILQLFNAS